jgi:flagellar basal body-associated protein FliL
MVMSSQEQAAAETGGEAPKKGKKKVLFIALGVVGLLAGAGVPVFLMMGGEPKKEEAAEHEEVVHEEIKRVETADLGQFIVNLGESSSFLKVRVLIEYDAAIIDKHVAPPPGGEEGGKAHGGGASGGSKEPAGGGMHPYITKSENKLRDEIIRILSSKRAEDLLTGDGKARLKEELVDGINEALGLEEPPVTGVLFTEFIIQ